MYMNTSEKPTPKKLWQADGVDFSGGMHDVDVSRFVMSFADV